MSLVTTHGLGKSFGGLDVFAGLSLSVPQQARIAIVGPNGIGKTTLLRIIAGRDVPSSGTVHISRGLTIGYLPQESVVETQNTLWEECLLPMSELVTQSRELARLEAEMADHQMVDDDVMERYGTLQSRFEHGGGYTFEMRIRQVLAGLEFSPDDYGMPLSCLSGGQRTRALLARLLLEAPGLLILDEPTNHLDTAAVEWLENYIQGWDGAVLIVSHDRYLLDKVCNTMWEMTRAGVETYRGNYSHYLRQRQERWELREKEFEAERGRLEKELDYIKRNISAQNVAQSRGRLKRMSRQIQAIEQIGLEAMRGRKWLDISSDVQIADGAMNVEEAEQRLRSLRNPVLRPRQLKLKLRAGQRGGNIVLRTRNLAIGYPERPLFTVPDLELQRQGCAALIGANGTGKTTFLKTALGLLPPLEGKAELGASLDIGYFAQAHEGLNPDNTLVKEIESIAPTMMLYEIRSYLARYLFTGEDAFKKVAVLSGGERGRLALAKLALGNSNLLLLDEPTNHLDIPSQEVLQNVLADFDGTIILVSHDRYLIDALATQIWEIDREHAVLRIYEGTYSEYRSSRETLAAQTAAAASPADERRQSKTDAYRAARAAKNLAISEERRAKAEERRRKTRTAEIEARIAILDRALADLGRRLANPPQDRAEVQRLGQEYMAAESELEALMEEMDGLKG
jgi:ATP-binding cassette subfamily F protein 3